MLRLKTFQLLYNIRRFVTVSKGRVGLLWFCLTRGQLARLCRKPTNLITLPVIYEIGFFAKKSSEDSDHMNVRLKNADRKYEEVKYEETLTILTDLAKESPTPNDEILWRLARIKYEFSKTASKTDKAKIMEESLGLLKDALVVNPRNGYVHKWMAILLDSLSSTKGVRERIELALQVRDHLLEALKYIPNDGTTHYILGVWYYTIADFTWYERKIASTLNSKFPSTTHEQALECFKQAEVVEPDFYSRNYLFLGKCYVNLKEKEKAIGFLKKARDYPQKTQEDKETNEEAVKLLQKIGVN